MLSSTIAYPCTSYKHVLLQPSWLAGNLRDVSTGVALTLEAPKRATQLLLGRGLGIEFGVYMLGPFSRELALTITTTAPGRLLQYSCKLLVVILLAACLPPNYNLYKSQWIPSAHLWPGGEAGLIRALFIKPVDPASCPCPAGLVRIHHQDPLY